MMNRLIDKKLITGFAIAFIAIIVNALIAYGNTNQLRENEQQVTHTYQVLGKLESTLSTLKDVETGQRAYLLTGDEQYLLSDQPLVVNISNQIQSLKQLTADNPDQQRRVVALKQKVTSKLNELQETVPLLRNKGLEAARESFLSGQDKHSMDEIRQQVSEMESVERTLLQLRAEKSQSSFQKTTTTFSLASLCSLGLLAFLYYLIRQTAEALQKYANDFEELYNHAPCGYHSLDKTGTFIRINDTELSMLGYTREEMIENKKFADLLTDESVQLFEKNFPVFQQQGWVHNLQLQMICKDGSILPIILNAIAIQDTEGNFFMSRSTVLDHTERQQAEELLKQAKDELELRVVERTFQLLSVNQHLQQELEERKQIQESLQMTQARFSGILEIANDAIISVDANQKITLFNQGAERIFGYSAQEVLGQSLDLLLPDRSVALHHQHVSDFSQSKASARRMGERSEIFGRRKDGREFPSEASISRLKLGNETVFTAILRDISDVYDELRLRKQTELALSQLAAIIESSEDAIISKTLEGTIISWNTSAERLYGYTAAEAIGHSVTLIIPPDRLDEEAEILHNIQHGERICYQETVRQRKNGTLVDLALTISPVKDATGKIVGISTIARDITDRLQIDRMKSEFISVVSHELRTPLTSIHGSLGMLASGLLKPDSPQGKRMLQIAVDSTDRLVRLINDILDIERIESGRVKMEKQLCKIDEFITAAVNVVQPLADKAGVTLSISSLPIQVSADLDRIVQILTNLLSNAIKFSSAGNTVWLAVQQQSEHILFTVKDQGRGIPTDKLDSIFERFQQVDSSDARNHEGTGLGLAICRSIVQQHDGRIWAESVLGEGSTFSFTLPIQKISQIELPKVPESLHSTASLVLVCDHDPCICNRLQTLLEQQNYRVLAVTSSQEAIAQATTQHPDVILLNLVIPGINDWEMMSKLKEQPETQNIPIIICNISTPGETHPQNTNFVDSVSKPLNESLLLQSLQPGLSKHPSQIRVLIVEDDVNLAHLLMTLFEQHQIEAFHVTTAREAISLSQQINPDLIILDLILPEGDGFAVVEWLQQYNKLSNTLLVVYSGKDLDTSERDRLKLGHTEFLSKERVTIPEFEQRVMALLQKLIQTEEK